MDFSSISEVIIVFLLAAIKFAMALGYMLLPNNNFSYLQIVIVLISGGSTGIILFYFFTSWINTLINKIIPPKKNKQIFTKSKRRFISIKNKYGLLGISFITPVLLSIPFGCFLASRYYSDKKLTIPILILGIVFWAFVLPLIKLSY